MGGAARAVSFCGKERPVDLQVRADSPRDGPIRAQGKPALGNPGMPHALANSGILPVGAVYRLSFRVLGSAVPFSFPDIRGRGAVSPI
jgi:hypothetical protein